VETGEKSPHVGSVGLHAQLREEEPNSWYADNICHHLKQQQEQKTKHVFGPKDSTSENTLKIGKTGNNLNVIQLRTGYPNDNTATE
jgi:hypothetical protein